MKAIVRWSVENPVAVNLLFTFLLVAGVLTYVTLPREALPSYDLDMVEITTYYPGGTAEEVERLVTQRIEEAIHDIPDIAEVRSLSRQGWSSVEVDVSFGGDLDEVSRRIEAEVRKIRELPQEVEEEPTVVTQRSELPVLIINIAGAADVNDLKRWIDAIEAQLLQVPGVASVVTNGLTDPELWVECDPLKLIAHDLTTDDVLAAVRAWSVNVPGGTAESGRTATVMRTVGQALDAADLERALIRPGSKLTIGDVAEVREARDRSETYSRFNGRASINLMVRKTQGGNVVGVSKDVRAVISDFEDRLPDGLTISYTADTAEYVRARFRTVYQSGVMAIAIILAILYLLLNGRVALVTALGVPTAVAGAVILMPLTTLTVNLFTLFGFILVLGLVVDDAIIISENIYRRMELGEPPLKAAMAGGAEVAWPVTVTVLTTMAAFFPMVFLPGVLGRYMAIIPLVVALTLAVSLVEALVILPSHVAEISVGSPPPRHKTNSDGLMARLRRRYRAFLDWCLRWRYAVLSASLALTLVTASAALTHMPLVLLTLPDIPIFLVRIEAPPSAPLDESLSLVQEAEKRTLEAVSPEDVRAVIGWVGIFVRPNHRPEFGTHLGELWVELTEFDQRRRSGYETMADVREALEGQLPGARSVTFIVEEGFPTAPDVETHLLGDDYTALRQTADDIQNFLNEIPGVSDVKDDDLPGQTEKRVRIAPERAALYGADTRSIGLALQAALEGIRAGSFRRGDEEVEIQVKLPEHLRKGDFTLERLAVPVRPTSANGGRATLVPLADVAHIEEGQGRMLVRRRDRQRAITVTAEVDETVTTPTEVQALLDAELTSLPPGVRARSAGKSEELDDLLVGMAKALAAAMLFIYFMLGTLFRSFLQPLAIMLTIPFAIVGVVLGFALTGQALDTLALVGTVALSGIVVNDSLVLIDFINVRRRSGASRTEAILESGEARFRPILLTTVTTVGGLIPLALTKTGQAAMISPMADAICWGLSLATLLTLILVPCAYAVVEDIAVILRRLLGRTQTT